jgi:glutamate-ammonia-ligase adenylyltransferase
MNAGSDLDLIVIYDAAGAEVSEGPKPLAVRAYFARLTQALVTALSAPTAAGRLYAVDMRLRPSGRQGPVATALAAFEDYQRAEAWTWEHLALTRARGMAGDAGLVGAVEAVRRAVIASRAGAPALGPDVAAMRARLAAARPGGGPWEAKWGPGRLLDLDLFAQYCALAAGSPARRAGGQWQAGLAAGLIGAADAARLAGVQGLMWRLQAGLRLLALPEGAAPGTGAAAFLLRETAEAGIDALQARIAAEAAAAAAVIAAHLPQGGEDAAG